MTTFHATRVDKPALRAWRLERVREKLRERDLAGILLYDPLNIRYATDTSNMQVWTMHNHVRYAFIATDGPVILFDYHATKHLSEGIEVLDEIRPATGYLYFSGGDKSDARAAKFAAEIDDVMREHCGQNRRLAVDKIEPIGLFALQKHGIELRNGQEVMELARYVKNDVEIQAMQESIDACEIAMRRMRDVFEPGITENYLWSVMNQVNAELGGEWVETRLLTSGPRTNPWFRECNDRVIERGDIMSFDTDLVGPGGYCCDISRSWLCGDGKPSDEQRWLYEVARKQIEDNIAMLKPGMSFREIAEKGSALPEDCVGNRYSVLMHGVGLCDEYPAIYYDIDHDEYTYDGVVEANTVMCVESLIGRVGGRECMKLEEQVLITDNGVKRLSTFEYEDHWL